MPLIFVDKVISKLSLVTKVVIIYLILKILSKLVTSFIVMSICFYMLVIPNITINETKLFNY